MSISNSLYSAYDSNQFIIITYIEYETETEHESWQLSDGSSCHGLCHQCSVCQACYDNVERKHCFGFADLLWAIRQNYAWA